MNRDLWNRVMIGLMAATILVCLEKIWSMPGAAQDPRYWIGIGLGTVVIVLKMKEIKQSQERAKH
ncbi:MAG: hypothetical protein HOP18_05895 [Deltaproteobacteria bacterium]|nr:hypothetical protein [Deltaproteobacteria bacterium]